MAAEHGIECPYIEHIMTVMEDHKALRAALNDRIPERFAQDWGGMLKDMDHIKKSLYNGSGLHTRVRKLENRQVWVTGFATAVGMAGGLSVNSVVAAFKEIFK